MKNDYIFVSYSRKDTEIVLSVIQRLQNAGYDVRYDTQDIVPATRWRDEIAELTRNCTLCLAFHSNNSSKSIHCDAELNCALEYKRPIFSVYLEDGVHLSSGVEMYIKPLQSLNWSKYGTDLASFIEKLETSDVFVSCRSKTAQYNLPVVHNYPVRECKVIFLGVGGSGKSSLITMIHRSRYGKSLLLEGYDCMLRGWIPSDDVQEMPTEGALLSEWNTLIEEENYRLRFLEFGGQQIMWPMHNLLLTQKTVYVVVCDSSDASEGQVRLEQSAKLWLRTVNWYAPDCPVILVLNKIDTNENADVNRAELRKIMPGIKFLKTSAKTGVGIEALIDTIKDAVQKCPYGFDMDVSGIERELEWKRTENYITYDVYQTICRRHNILEKAYQDSLLNMLVSLGAVCHYPTTENWIVVNPNWLANGIYRIITDRHSGCDNGFFRTPYIYSLLEKPVLFGLFPEMSYNPKEAQYIIHIMRMLHISHAVERGLDMIPLKLDKTPPQNKDEEFQSKLKDTAIHLRWEADFLPVNLMYLIIARISPDDHHFIWQRGGWFCSNLCEALVEISDDNARLDLYVWSSTHSVVNRKLEYMDKLRSVVNAVIAEELARRKKQDIIVEEILFWRDDRTCIDVAVPLRRVLMYYKHPETEEIYLPDIDESISIDDLLDKTYIDPKKIVQGC